LEHFEIDAIKTDVIKTDAIKTDAIKTNVIKTDAIKTNVINVINEINLNICVYLTQLKNDWINA
jgi:hypothetical protein